ncbi:hypothetical protein OUZ56_009526 [Daphnia magna]|uniref:Uncharacterized protein n=1 Tax=Daphnia magna TaxID=35525 RepID=A0ABR0AG89_9CRUS|nr:hypothetical protein OUZ56_009526 [Daphnia magna]
MLLLAPGKVDKRERFYAFLGEGILTATESFCTFLRLTTFNRNSTPNEQHQASRSAVYTDEAAVAAAFVALV